MATNKAKRSIHLAQHHPQPKPQPTEALPVGAHAYRCLAEMNNGLEQALHGLQELQKITYFSSSESLHGIHSLLSRIQAQATGKAMAVLIERETANARHFQRLCLESESAGR